MKINEIIIESKKGKLDVHHSAAHHSSWKFRDVGGYDRVYHLNRVMMAAAAADGISTRAIPDFEQESWIEKYNTAFPYTEADNNMIASALNTVDSEFDNVSKFEQSHEPPYIYNKSPVLAKPPIQLLKKGEKPKKMKTLKRDNRPT